MQPWRSPRLNAEASLKRRDRRYKLGAAPRSPRLNAEASLKRVQVLLHRLLGTGSPRLNAEASLKPVGNRGAWCSLPRFSSAKRRGLIEAARM